MKKFFITLLSLSLSAILLILAGCGGATPLSFNNSFNGETPPSSDYTETLTYTVTNGDYNDLVRSKDLSTEIVDFSTNGTLTVNFNICTKGDDDFPTQILEQTDIELEGKIYHLTSNLSLNSVYTVNGEGGGEKSEYVQSEVYFLTTESAFAPIYSKVKQSYNVMLADSSDGKTTVSVDEVKNEYETLYKKDNYIINKLSEENGKSNSYEYDFKSVIDNAQLLFVLRNVSFEKTSNYSLPTVSPSYGIPKTLTVSNKEEVTKTLDVMVNGRQVNESLSVKNLSFYVNDNKNTGTPQYVSIQKSESSNKGIPNKAFMTEYAQSLICYGSFTSMGALIYKLSSIEYKINN